MYCARRRTNIDRANVRNNCHLASSNPCRQFTDEWRGAGWGRSCVYVLFNAQLGRIQYALYSSPPYFSSYSPLAANRPYTYHGISYPSYRTTPAFIIITFKCRFHSFLLLFFNTARSNADSASFCCCFQIIINRGLRHCSALLHNTS